MNKRYKVALLLVAAYGFAHADQPTDPPGGPAYPVCKVRPGEAEIKEVTEETSQRKTFSYYPCWAFGSAMTWHLDDTVNGNWDRGPEVKIFRSNGQIMIQVTGWIKPDVAIKRAQVFVALMDRNSDKPLCVVPFDTVFDRKGSNVFLPPRDAAGNPKPQPLPFDPGCSPNAWDKYKRAKLWVAWYSE